MIIDNIKNLIRYDLPHKDAIIDFLRSQDLVSISDGEHDILGRDLFVRVMSYEPKPAVENKFEAHRIYADLQLVVVGCELMQTAAADQLVPVTEYDQVKEYQFFQANGFINDLVIRSNEFAIFFPGEAHRPSCQYLDQKIKVKKLVFKIKV